MVAIVVLRLAEALKLNPYDKLQILTYALLHDADEAWTGDIASPVKRFVEEIPSEKFMGLWAWHMEVTPYIRDLVKVADLAADIRFLLDHGSSAHATQVREGLQYKLVGAMSAFDIKVIGPVIEDFLHGKETYIDDYIG